MKLILAILVALSLIGSTGTAQAAPSISCTMAGADQGMAADHGKMGCCTPECATTSAAAVMPALGVCYEEGPPNGQFGPSSPATALPSFMALMDDPPPRGLFA